MAPRQESWHRAAGLTWTTLLRLVRFMRSREDLARIRILSRQMADIDGSELYLQMYSETAGESLDTSSTDGA